MQIITDIYSQERANQQVINDVKNEDRSLVMETLINEFGFSKEKASQLVEKAIPIE